MNRSRGGGNVEIWWGLPDFHGPGISTALAHKNRSGGSGDSILQARSSSAFAMLIF